MVLVIGRDQIDPLAFELNAHWLHIRRTARLLAARRLGVELTLEHPAADREDETRALAVWRAFLAGDRDGDSPITTLGRHGDSDAAHALERRELGDDERAFAARWYAWADES